MPAGGPTSPSVQVISQRSQNGRQRSYAVPRPDGGRTDILSPSCQIAGRSANLTHSGRACVSEYDSIDLSAREIILWHSTASQIPVRYCINAPSKLTVDK